MMKYIILLLFTLNLSAIFAADDDPSIKVAPEEQELFLEAIKEKQVSDQLLGSDLLADCKTSPDYTNAPDTSTPPVLSKNDVLRKCVDEKLNSVSDDDMKKLSKKLDLGSYDKEAAKSTKTIREYLNQRLSEAIYGVDKDQNGKLKALKERKVVDHGIYYQLYMEQIGKNTLLAVSQYCLENFGFKNPTYMVDVEFPEKEGDPAAIRTYEVIKPADPVNKPNLYSINPTYENRNENLKKVPGISFKAFWESENDIKEYEVCASEKLSDCKNQTNSRTVHMIEQLKLAEFQLGKSSKEMFFTKHRYQFCATQVLKNMCEIYKCRNVYDNNSDNQTISKCSDSYKISVGRDVNDKGIQEVGLKSYETKGQLACNIMGQLEDYRNMLKLTQEGKEKFKKDLASLTKLERNVIGDVYSGSGNGEKKLTELTSISAKELTEKVSEIAGSAEDAAELRSNCMEGEGDDLKLIDGWEKNEACKVFKPTLSKDKFENIQAEAEAQAVVYLKKFKDLNSEEEVKKFIEENGLQNILKNKDVSSMSADQLKKLIEEHYKAEKVSQLDAIKQKFANEVEMLEKPKDKAEEQSNESKQQNIATKTVEEMEQHRKRIESLFQYSNIVSSYLDVQVDQGKSLGANTTGREMEADNIIKDDSEKYVSEFGETGASGSSGGEMDYVQVLDQILNEPEDPKK